MIPERRNPSILGGDYGLLRSSLRRLYDDLSDGDPGGGLDPATLKVLALRDLLSDEGAPADVDWLAWLVTFEELGPSPIGPALLANVALSAVVLHLLGAGESGQGAELLDAALSGETTLALAIQEAGPDWAQGRYATTAGGAANTRLRGEKLKVAHASAADVLLVVATERSAVQIYAVDATADGVSLMDEPAVEPSVAVSDVSLKDAPAIRLCDRMIDNDSLVRALSFAKLAAAALCTGSAVRVLDLAADYLQVRRQFGKYLQEFQAVTHRLGRSRVRLEQMRALAYRAALEGAHAEWSSLAHSAAIARMFCADGYASITAEAMRVEGAIGITWENALGGHYRRAHWLRDLLGGRAIERRLILEEAARLAL